MLFTIILRELDIQLVVIQFLHGRAYGLTITQYFRIIQKLAGALGYRS